MRLSCKPASAATAAILVLPAAASAKPVAAPPVPPALDAAVRKAMQERHMPGMAVAVVRNGKLAWTKAYGLADVERNVPATTDTLFEIGSVTKQFTAAAVMMLVEAGKIGLDEKASAYLADLPAAWSGVTVRNLLTHTSGIPNYTAARDFAWEKDYTPEEILKLVSDKPLDFSPGAKWDYSNTNFYLLGMIVGKVTGQPWEEFAAKHIFGPLGMARTRIADEEVVIPKRALGYEWTGKWANRPLLHRGAPGAAGAILSTAPDMAKWAAALDARKLLSDTSYQQMWTPARLSDGSATTYGFGWAVDRRNGHRAISHGGGTAGFSSIICRYPDDKLDIVVLTNLGSANAGGIADVIAGYYVPALKPQVAKAEKDPDPKATARMRGIVENLLSDKPDLSPFGPEMQKALTPEMLAGVRQQMATLGPLKTFTYLSGKTGTGGTTSIYRVVFGTTALRATATVAPDGKVSGLWMGAE